MIRTTELHNRAVVDIDGAEKLGYIDKIILDPDARRVAGFVLSRGSIMGGGPHTIVPAASVRAIGPDAVTVHRRLIDAADAAAIEPLPRLSDLVRRKVVSETGQLLGFINDVLIDERDGRILGYRLVEPNSSGKWDEMLGAADRSTKNTLLLRADAELRAGKELVVVPDHAIVDEVALEELAASPARSAPLAGTTPAAPSASEALPASPWAECKPVAVQRGQWIDRDDSVAT